MKSAMGAASQLPGGELTDVDDAPAPVRNSTLHLNVDDDEKN